MIDKGRVKHERVKTAHLLIVRKLAGTRALCALNRARCHGTDPARRARTRPCIRAKEAEVGAPFARDHVKPLPKGLTSRRFIFVAGHVCRENYWGDGGRFKSDAEDLAWGGVS